jgi:hypothetical protein
MQICDHWETPQRSSFIAAHLYITTGPVVSEMSDWLALGLVIFHQLLTFFIERREADFYV